MRSPTWCRCLAVLAGTAAWFLTANLWAAAQERPDKRPPVRQMLAGLLKTDSEARQKAIRQWARTRDARLAKVLTAYQQGTLYNWNGQLVLCSEMVNGPEGTKRAPLHDPLTQEPLRDPQGQSIVVPAEKLKELYPGLREQQTLRDAILRLQLWSEDPETQGNAIEDCGDRGDPEFLEPLQALLARQEGGPREEAIRESIALLRLSDEADQTRQDRLAAVRELGDLRSLRALPALTEQYRKMQQRAEQGDEVDSGMLQAYRQAVEEIESHQRFVSSLSYLFNGLSLGSILILMALGLSVIFGLMGVINMAHGELMMIGAYATYEMQHLFVAYLPEHMFNWYYVAALPLSFVAAALVGYLLEMFVVRYLYGRPLDTLLATWGISLILIQLVRLRYGDNIAVNNPTWLRGGVAIFPDLILPYNRCFIVILSAVCVVVLYSLMSHTKLGLLIRATMQNRETAESLGVNTRRIDGYTFALGAGMAGIAGYALTLIGGVTPDMGQNYIVDSFLVVVTGGVGKLAGVVCAGLGIGVLNKVLEPIVQAVWGKVLILICVVIFIQWRPAGLFPPKGRLADV